MDSTYTFADLNKYYKLQKIGEGGFGEVYKIKEKETDKIYAAKISLIPIIDNSQDEMLYLAREVNNSASIDHPNILKFIDFSPTGFNNEPTPVSIIEYAPNGSLSDIIDLERKALAELNWDDTKKLINIYGISSGMKYLHENEILHRDLKPQNILMDGRLFSKISDFGLSKKIHNSNSNTAQSQIGIKGTPAYLAPEVFETKINTKASDVYAFGLILYELLTTNIPFQDMDEVDIYKEVVINKRRPPFNIPINQAYRDLIERCWSQDPNKRPTFAQIVEELETNHDFILPSVNEDDYLDYIEFIKNSQTSYKEKEIVKLQDFVRNPESPSFKKVNIHNLVQNKQSNLFLSFLSSFFKKEKLFPDKQFSEIDKNCQNLVIQAENDPEKQFCVGSYLIEGKNNFPININLGVKYFERSISGKCIESASYLSKMLIDGNIIPRDLNKAKNILLKFLNSNDIKILSLYARILYKEKKYIESRKYFEQVAKKNDPYSMYKYGKILFCGYGGDINVEDAKHYLNLSKDSGFRKSELYLLILTNYQKNTSFINLPTESQDFLLKQIIKYNIKYNNDDDISSLILLQNQIYITFKDAQRLSLNKSLDSIDFRNILKTFDKITIEILYPSKEYEQIIKKVRIIKFFIDKINVYVLISRIKSISYKFGPNKLINIIKMDEFVEKIGPSSFSYCDKITEIKISPLITSIGKKSFDGCTSLKSINIPSSVTSINESTFSNCHSLESVSIPSSVKSIGDFSFYHCNSLKDLTIPSYVTFIGKHAFCDCSSLTQIVIPSSVTSIKEATFLYCSSLVQITIPSSVKSIEKNAFYGCRSLKQIEIPSSVTLIGCSAFRCCSSLQKITISSTYIENSAFEECASLEQVTISKTVKSIGEYAFYECKSLKQVIFEGPSLLKSIPNSCFSNCKSLTQITIPSYITSIGTCAFNKCTSLEQVLFEEPFSLKSIGASCFYLCESLKQITIPSSVISIDGNAFTSCYSLKQVLFEEPFSLKSIGSYCFKSCKSLAQIAIPSSVTYVGDSALDTSLTTLEKIAFIIENHRKKK